MLQHLTTLLCFAITAHEIWNDLFVSSLACQGGSVLLTSAGEVTLQVRRVAAGSAGTGAFSVFSDLRSTTQTCFKMTHRVCDSFKRK